MRRLFSGPGWLAAVLVWTFLPASLRPFPGLYDRLRGSVEVGAFPRFARYQAFFASGSWAPMRRFGSIAYPTGWLRAKARPDWAALVRIEREAVDFLRLVPGRQVSGTGVEYRINRYGWRGPERTPDRPAGTERVAVIGNSTVFGIGLPYAAAFAARLEAALSGPGPCARRFEVLDFSVPAATPEMMLAAARRVLREFAVDRALFVTSMRGPLDELDFSRRARGADDLASSAAGPFLRAVGSPGAPYRRALNARFVEAGADGADAPAPALERLAAAQGGALVSAAAPARAAAILLPMTEGQPEFRALYAAYARGLRGAGVEVWDLSGADLRDLARWRLAGAGPHFNAAGQTAFARATAERILEECSR